MSETIYLRCSHCGTMKPNANGDPDDELAAIADLLGEIDADGETVIEQAQGLVKSFHELIRSTMNLTDRYSKLVPPFPRPDDRYKGQCWMLSFDEERVYPIWATTVKAALEELDALHGRTFDATPDELNLTLEEVRHKGLEEDYVSFHRLEEWDDLGHEPTPWDWLERSGGNGYGHECAGCGGMAFLEDGDVYWSLDGQVYCEECGRYGYGEEPAPVVVSHETMKFIMSVRDAPNKYPYDE